ncbi:TPA: glycosyltransferase [Vibrio parahaemolyticus]|uniref:Uncharacterized protein n=1 Tax=Vibrio parahaemolyticus TaxID=670 RepID=A0A7M1W947_VIBPH|nr:glycosyltransferase [Vibrio parahaemolyticus]MDF4940322.1 glycosyltransferase [Vibrio parahaemolyticus]QOS23554.1 hypothetical protein VP368_00015 [Vibrio parahaemolyticus]TOK37025.1 hypothetical protein CGI20_16715 [Vibrio parahaemolyticus]HCE3704092.1 glycosyltransferase [Vibrio parahaemolyticus]HCG6653173.1 glycosyltransferase [Vibrio parahaemolyticus]
MKVLIISDYNSGGAGIVAKDTGKLLEKEGYDIKFYWGCDRFTFSPFRYLVNLKAKEEIYTIMDSYSPNVIMLHNFDNLLSPYILKAIKDYKSKNKNVKVIMTLHDYHMLCPSNSLSYYEKKRRKFFTSVPTYFNCVLKCLDHRSFFHSFLRVLQWTLHYKVLRNHSVIDCFLAPSKFMFSKAKEVIEVNKLNVTRNPTIVCKNTVEKKRCENNHVSISFVGRLSEEKGILEFVSSICSILIDSPVNVNFNIVGDGPHLNAIKDAIKENVNKNIEFTMFGKVPKSQVDTILARSEFVLLPSLCYENAPLSLVEGAMHGCKIITMNYGGMKEIAEMQPYSFLLNSFSESELQRLLRYIDNNRNNETDNSKLIHSYSESQYVDTINDIFQRFRCE